MSLEPAPDETILYHYWRSSSSWRVRWALAIKGIAHQAVPVDLLKGEQRSEAHRRRNPLGLVPVLHIDGTDLSESVAILEYLDETRPAMPLLPQDPLSRARVRQLVQIIAADTQPLQNLSVLEHVEALTATHENRRRWAERYISRGFDAYEATLTLFGGPFIAGPYSCGDAITMADLCLIPQCHNARRQGIELSPTGRWPRIAAIEAACLATQAARQTAPDAVKPA